jgi:hypothetical protein
MNEHGKKVVCMSAFIVLGSALLRYSGKDTFAYNSIIIFLVVSKSVSALAITRHFIPLLLDAHQYEVLRRVRKVVFFQGNVIGRVLLLLLLLRRGECQEGPQAHCVDQAHGPRCDLGSLVDLSHSLDGSNVPVAVVFLGGRGIAIIHFNVVVVGSPWWFGCGCVSSSR